MLITLRPWVRPPHSVLFTSLNGKAANPIGSQFLGSNPRVNGLIPQGIRVSWCNLVSTLDFESNDPGSNPGETFPNKK